MTENDTTEFPDSMASALRDEDVHRGAIAFCREYPDSGLADHVRLCVRNDMDLFANASSYERNFLEHGPKAALSNADPTRSRKIATLFPDLAYHPNVPDDVPAAGESDEEDRDSLFVMLRALLFPSDGDDDTDDSSEPSKDDEAPAEPDDLLDGIDEEVLGDGA